MKRTLVLKREPLAELSTEELREVGGADFQATPLCVTDGGTACRISDAVLSLCRCLTQYCSIDVC